MKNCFDCLRDKKFLWFVTGAASVIVGKQVLRSQTTRSLCVKSIAKAMKMQSDAQEAFQNMKEDAEDLCYDAKETLSKEEDHCEADA